MCQQQLQHLQHSATAALLQPAALTWQQQLGSSNSSSSICSRRAVACSSIANGTRNASSFSIQQAASSRQTLFIDSRQQQQPSDAGRSRLLQQRQAAAAWEEEQQQQQWQQQQQQMDAVGEAGGYVVPRQRFVLRPAKRYSPRECEKPAVKAAALELSSKPATKQRQLNSCDHQCFCSCSCMRMPVQHYFRAVCAHSNLHAVGDSTDRTLPDAISIQQLSSKHVQDYMHHMHTSGVATLLGSGLIPAAALFASARHILI
jgi:hypothetical protein